MKKLFLLSTLCCFFIIAKGQIQTPAASPFSKITQDLGLTEVTVEYSRPSKKNRDIFSESGLVPFGEIWRTGANSATKISFSDDVTINGQDLKAGSYAITSIPDNPNWILHFHPYTKSRWSTYKEMSPALSVEINSKSLNQSVETFSIYFNNLSSTGGDMIMAWDKTSVELNIDTDTDKRVMSSIEKVISGPSADDYYRAGSYYHTSGKDLEKALEYIELATSGENKKFWQVRRKALILADLGKMKEAIKAASLSKDLALAAGNNDYVRMNEKSIAEWSMSK